MSNEHMIPPCNIRGIYKRLPPLDRSRPAESVTETVTVSVAVEEAPVFIGHNWVVHEEIPVEDTREEEAPAVVVVEEPITVDEEVVVVEEPAKPVVEETGPPKRGRAKFGKAVGEVIIVEKLPEE